MFGAFNFESDDQSGLLLSLKKLCDGVVQSAMKRNLKLPLECTNFDFNLEGSQFTEQPLPQWCNGFLAGLELFDHTKLNDSQATMMVEMEEAASTFSSYDDLRASTSIAGDNWKMVVTQMRIDLESDLDLFFGVMRFGAELDFEEFDQMMDELEGMMDPENEGGGALCSAGRV